MPILFLRALAIVALAFCCASAAAQEGVIVNLGTRPKIPGQEAFKPLGEQPRIFFGTPDSVFDLVVEIKYDSKKGTGYCTGTFVARNKVLTAGHCGCGIPGSYFVLMGQSSGSDAIFKVTQIIQFDPNNCSGGDLSGKDLALLGTATDLDCKGEGTLGFKPSLSPNLCIVANNSPALTIRSQFKDPTQPKTTSIESVWSLRSRLKVNQKLVAVGYGLTELGTHGSRLMANIPILSVTCDEGWYPYLCAPFAEMLLADRSPPSLAVDTCAGDSGGPVFVFDPDNKSSELIATVSRAASFPQGPEGCGGGGVYELIGRNSVIRWLNSNGVPDMTIFTKNEALNRAEEINTELGLKPSSED